MSTIERLEKLVAAVTAWDENLKAAERLHDVEAVGHATIYGGVARDELMREVEEYVPALIAVARKAEAVNARWETPTWKSAEPTAKLMNELRDALATLKETRNG